MTPLILFAALTGDPLGPKVASPPNGILITQVLLDRAGHSPGVFDGTWGSNSRRAVAAFERSTGLAVDGEIDPEVSARLRSDYDTNVVQQYTIQADDIDRLIDVPESMTDQSKLEHLGFETALEALAEKFQMSQGLMQRLNVGKDFSTPGTVIQVVMPFARDLPAKVEKIEVDKQNAELRAFDADGKLLASYPATVGSSDFPSPAGEMEVRAIAATPTYYFNPEGRTWGPDERLTIAAGPNNPVGSTWIDLSKEGYGIHGTPTPELIGKTASHGCVRLTNWDAAQLSRAVSAGTKVIFV
jgi:lipoprotein-anchoring transpeptidase ErfK/SrfK